MKNLLNKRNEKCRCSKITTYILYACAIKSSIRIKIRAFSLVDSKTTIGAQLFSNASFQRKAHKHHLSPSLTPSKPNSGNGVDKSFPTCFENFKKSLVARLQPTLISLDYSNPS